MLTKRVENVRSDPFYTRVRESQKAVLECEVLDNYSSFLKFTTANSI